MTDLFFVYCPESGFDCFLTLDAALDEANERIQGYLGDVWSEEVTGVCAGKITHRAKMCDQVFPDGEIDEDGIDESGELWGPDCDYKCDYKMLPARKNPTADAAQPVEVVQSLTAMVDAAMVEMKNIHPPLRRKECERLIRAALTAHHQQEGYL